MTKTKLPSTKEIKLALNKYGNYHILTEDKTAHFYKFNEVKQNGV